MSGESKRAILDALHAELLVDVQAATAEVAKLRTELPAILADIHGAAEALSGAAKTTTSDFEAMGHALVGVIRRHSVEEREAAALANLQSAKATKSALDQFTKNFWLLSGLTAVNALLLVTILALQAFRT